MPHIYVSDFRACILAIFWLISLEEHFVEFRVLTVDTYDCPPCTWAEAFLYKPLDLRTSPPMNCLTFLVIAATPGVSVSQRVCAVGLYLCSICIDETPRPVDDLEGVTFTFILGAILFEDNFNEAA